MPARRWTTSTAPSTASSPTGDFPAIALLAILCGERGLPGPTLDAVLKCSNKCLQRALAEARQEIGRIGDPVNDLLSRVDLPPAMRGITGNHMIAESLIDGFELAPEGCVHGGEIFVHGLIDVVRGENGKSTERVVYPSRIPDDIAQRVTDVTRRVLQRIGFDHGCFNVEYFWDRERDSLRIVEINPRLSQSHSNLFEKVDGTSNHAIAVQVALGERPHFLEADRPVAMIAVRLSDVAPDDRATRITYGLLNLTHRHGHDRPRALEPSQRYRVIVPLCHVAQAFPRGHRLRLSLSTSYWPLVWPLPEPVRLRIHPQDCALNLPVRAPREDDARIAFAPPEATPPPTLTALEVPRHEWLVHRDPARHTSTLEVVKDEGLYRIDELDLEVADRTWDWYNCRDDGTGDVRGKTRTERAFRRGHWSVRTTTRTVLIGDAGNFYVHAELDGWEQDQRVYSRNWAMTIPRRLV